MYILHLALKTITVVHKLSTIPLFSFEILTRKKDHRQHVLKCRDDSSAAMFQTMLQHIFPALAQCAHTRWMNLHHNKDT